MNGSSALSAGNVSFVIENGQRFSTSVLWRLQRAYYQQRGIAAWNQGSIPHYITNNPVIAGAYARIVTGFLRDCLRQQALAGTGATTLDLAQPVYILEPGAGSGRFAYHFLKRFLPLLEQPGLRDLRIVYVLTDMVDQNVEFWRQHPRLEPFFQSGQLDVARFDPLNDSQVKLLVSGAVLTPGDLRNPLIVLANYFFCVIPTDIFSIEQGILREELVKTVCTNAQINRSDPEILPYLRIELTARFAPVDYYLEDEDNQLLQSYARSLNRSYLTFPHSALTCLRNFSRLSGGSMLLVAGDRGFYRLESMKALGEPALSLHSNSVSMPVNFHAIGEFFKRREGQAYFTQSREEGLVITACVLGKFEGGSVETRYAYRDAVENGGPDDFFQVKKAVEGVYGTFHLDQLLAFLRVSGYDGNVFSGCAASLQRLLEDATQTQQELAYEVLVKVWETYYPIGEPQNVPQKLARLFMTLSCYREALSCLYWSISLYGEDEETRQLIETCRRYSWDIGDTFMDPQPGP